MNVIGSPAPAGRSGLEGLPGREAWRRWMPALAALGFAFALLGPLFAEEVTAAIQTWDSSTAYNHCWLVLPVAAWLAWQRRQRLAGLLPAPSLRLCLLALPVAGLWLAMERLGIMEGRQLTALALAEILLLAVLGLRIGRAMAAPLAYLVFLVPFGAFATPVLQDLTAGMIELGLGLAGISHYRDGLSIETPEGVFLVAEACAGLRFLVAALAFGAFYALTLFRSPGRRLLVMLLAMTVPVLANGLRALGIVLLGHYLGSAEAAAADHVIYGWGFFSAIILLLILAGLPFREDGEGQPVPAARASPPAPASRAWGAALLALALAAIGPGLVASLGTAAPAMAAAPRLSAPEACEVLAAGTELRCPGATLLARLEVFPSRVTWRPVGARRNILGGAEDDTATAYDLAFPTGRAAWQVRLLDEGRIVAAAAWLDGAPATGGLRSRAIQAWNSLRGGQGRPVVAAVELRPRPDEGLTAAAQRGLLEAVLARQETEGLTADAAALSRQGR